MTEIRKVSAEELYPLRLAVLRNGSQNPADAYFSGDEEESSLHVALYEGGVLAAGGSLISSTNDFIGADNPYRVRGLAVYPEYRGNGYAKAILAYIEFYGFEEKKADVIWLYAREKAAGLYEKLGYVVSGEAVEIQGIGRHYLMYKAVCDYRPGCKGCH